MRIILYSNDCPRCKILKQKLREKSYQFEEENSVDKMLSLGINEVPVLNVAGAMLNYSQAMKWVCGGGFNEEQ